jgi:transposase
MKRFLFEKENQRLAHSEQEQQQVRYTVLLKASRHTYVILVAKCKTLLFLIQYQGRCCLTKLRRESRRPEMALKPRAIPEIPPQTVAAAHAVFSQGNIYIFLRARLGTIYQDELFADLYPERGRPASSP